MDAWKRQPLASAHAGRPATDVADGAALGEAAAGGLSARAQRRQATVRVGGSGSDPGRAIWLLSIGHWLLSTRYTRETGGFAGLLEYQIEIAIGQLAIVKFPDHKWFGCASMDIQGGNGAAKK